MGHQEIHPNLASSCKRHSQSLRSRLSTAYSLEVASVYGMQTQDASHATQSSPIKATVGTEAVMDESLSIQLVDWLTAPF